MNHNRERMKKLGKQGEYREAAECQKCFIEAKYARNDAEQLVKAFEQFQGVIGQAIDLIHRDDNYDSGMELLCILAGRQPTKVDVKPASLAELMGESSNG